MSNPDFENLRAHAQRGDHTNAHLARRVQELEAALDAAQDDAARLRAALQRVEWADDGMGRDVCPWCSARYPGNHAPDCQRQAALAQTAQISEVKA